MRKNPLVRSLQLLAVATLAAIAVACGGGGKNAPAASSSAPAAQPRAVSGDAAAAADHSGTGGTLRIAMTAGNIPIPDQFLTEGGEGKRFVGVNIYDTLLISDNGQGDHVPVPGPGLATSWTRSADNLTWTLNLRQGVKFTDGTPFNADAVVFAFDRILNPKAPFYSADQHSAGSSTFSGVASYKKIDDYTFQIVTKKPWSFLIYDMTSMNIPSPTAIMKWGNKDYPQHAIGTGPFMISKYVDGQVMEMVPNPDYWGQKAKLDKLIVYPMAEPAARLAALQSGQVDWAEVVPPDSIDQLKSAGYNVLLAPYPHALYYGFNVNRAPWSDVRVRQAVAYGIDRVGMVAIINGTGTPATQLMYEGNPWRDESFPGYSYDPAKAKALLAAAGVTLPLKMTVAYPTSGSGNMYPGPMDEKFQADMKAIGIDVTLAPLEWNTVLTLNRVGLYSPDYQQYDAYFFSPNTQTPLGMGGSFLSERLPSNGGCCNATGYSSKAFDDYMNQAAGEFDPVKQNALLAKAEGVLMQDVPIVPFMHDLNLRVLSPKVRGWVQPQSWTGDLTSVWMKK